MAPDCRTAAAFFKKARSGTAATFRSNTIGGGQYGWFKREDIEFSDATVEAC